MVDNTILYLLVGLSVLQVAFMVGCVYHAYRISKLIGSFFGWTLIIVGFALFTIRNASSLLLLPFLPADQLSSLLSSVGTTSLVFSSLLNVAAPLVLVVGMNRLNKTFELRMKKSEETP